MTKTKQPPAREPDLTSNLTLISLLKTKKTEQRSGWVLTFTAPLDNAAMDSEDESEIKKPMFGLLTLTRISLFPDPDAPQTPEAVQKALREKEQNPDSGNVKFTLSGKLKRRNVGARQESPAYSVWRFTLSSSPEKKVLQVLLDMASADGDPGEASVGAEFIQKAENADDEPQGPELFSEDNEMSEEDKKIMDGDFDQGPEANKLPKDPKTGEYLQPGEFEADAEKKSKRKRKVEAV